MEPRLTALERSNRRLTAAVVVLFSIVVVGLAGAAKPYPKPIHGGSLTLTAPNGNNIAHFGTNRNGDGKIVMYDRNGSPRILIVADKDYGAVHFVDDNVEFTG